MPYAWNWFYLFLKNSVQQKVTLSNTRQLISSKFLRLRCCRRKGLVLHLTLSFSWKFYSHFRPKGKNNWFVQQRWLLHFLFTMYQALAVVTDGLHVFYFSGKGENVFLQKCCFQFFFSFTLLNLFKVWSSCCLTYSLIISMFVLRNV